LPEDSHLNCHCISDRPDLLFRVVPTHAETNGRVGALVVARERHENVTRLHFCCVMALLPQPLALIEVGASAGVCLLPDRYGYDYGGRRVAVQLEQADAVTQRVRRKRVRAVIADGIRD
jgi:hypothetical protein